MSLKGTNAHLNAIVPDVTKIVINGYLIDGHTCRVDWSYWAGDYETKYTDPLILNVWEVLEFVASKIANKL